MFIREICKKEVKVNLQKVMCRSTMLKLVLKNGQTVSEDNYLHTYHEILNGHTICSPFLVSDVIELGS